MKPHKHWQRRDAGLAVLASVLVLATFALVVLLALQQRRAGEQRQVRQALQARLNREVERELLRLRRAEPKTGAAPVERAIDNILARSFDQMLALERRQAQLRRRLRQTRAVAPRRQVQHQLRRIGKELEIAKLWVLMLEDRRLAARRLESSGGRDTGKPPPDGPEASPPRSSAPPLPDRLGAGRPGQQISSLAYLATSLRRPWPWK